MINHPPDKDVAARKQTQHKLEVMARYYGAWPSIIAQTVGQWQWCPTRMWLIDTHAGAGQHLSEADPEGAIAGTPMLAAYAARNVQRKHRGVEIRVRATDMDNAVSAALEQRVAALRGHPPDAIDVTVRAMDWRVAAPELVAEIGQSDHLHGGKAGARDHQHRSLWFIDPYGVDSIDHALIEGLPVGSEVIVNLDLMTADRFIGRAIKTHDAAIAAMLDVVFGGTSWRALEGASLDDIARGFADSFSARRWKHREAHVMRSTGSQIRALVHLTTVDIAATTLAAKFRTAMTTGTIVKHTALNQSEKGKAVEWLMARFRGLTLTVAEMIALEAPYTYSQLIATCGVAESRDYGTWDPGAATMTWFNERGPGLFG